MTDTHGQQKKSVALTHGLTPAGIVYCSPGGGGTRQGGFSVMVESLSSGLTPTALLQTPACPPSSCVALGKLFNREVSVFSKI